jgi:TolB-like protein
MRRALHVLVIIVTLNIVSDCSSSLQQTAQKSAAAQYDRKADMDSALVSLTNQLVSNLKVKDKVTIAVIGFPDANGNITELSQYLSESLISRLVLSGKFNVIERKLLGQIIEEHKLNMQGLIDGATAKQFGMISGVTYLVSGTIIDMVKTVNVNARLISTESGAIVDVALVQIQKDDDIEQLLLKNVAMTTRTQGAATSDKSSTWLSESDFQKEVDQQIRLGKYPSQVEGRSENGTSQFRALFLPYPSGYFFFETRVGGNKTYYDGRNAELSSQGYKLVSLQTFIDSIGIERYQATWLKTQP